MAEITQKMESWQMGVNHAVEQLEVSFEGDDYTLDGTMTSLAVEPYISWQRRYHTSFPSLHPALTLGLKGYATYYSDSHMDATYETNGVQGSLTDTDFLGLAFLMGGPFAEWGLDHDWGSRSTKTGLFFYGSCMAGRVRLSSQNGEALSLTEEFEKSVDPEEWSALSEGKQEKIEEKLSKLESEMKEGKNYFVVSPRIGAGLRFQHRAFSVRVAAVYSPFPGSSEYGINLMGLSLETGIEVQLAK